MRSRSTRSRSLTPRLIFGLALIGFGVLFTLENLGLHVSDRIFELWPLILVVVGVVKLFDSAGSGLFLIALGVLFLLPVVVDRLRFQDILPMLLVLVGLRVVLRSFGIGGRRRTEDRDGDAVHRVRAFALLSGVKRQVESQALEGGDLTALLGACEVDFRGSVLAGGKAEVDVLAMWGGVDITVPEDWDVSLEVMPVMGGVEDKTTSSSRGPVRAGAERPHLAVKGFVLMGGVEVHH